LLEHHVELCKKHGITDIVMCVGYRKEKLMEHFGDGSRFGVSIKYSIEEELMNTGGAVKFAEDLLADRFIVANGDVASKLDYTKLIQFHMKKGGETTIVVHPSLHPEDSDLVEIGENDVVKRFVTKPHEFTGEGHVNNAGCYVMEKKVILEIGEKKFNMEKDVFPKLAARKVLYAYNTDDYLKDMGTFERYKNVQEDFCGD